MGQETRIRMNQCMWAMGLRQTEGTFLLAHYRYGWPQVDHRFETWEMSGFPLVSCSQIEL